MYNKWITYCGIVFFAILPWGTRFMYGQSPYFAEGEWGTFSIFASECVLWALIIICTLFLFNGVRRGVFSRVRGWPSERWLLVVCILFFGYLFVRSSFVTDNALAMQWTSRVIAAGVLFVVVSLSPHETKMLWIKTFVASMGVATCIGIAQFFLQYAVGSTIFGMALHDPAIGGTSVVETIDGRWLRAYATFAHPNIFGAYAVVAWLLSIVLLRYARPLSKGFYGYCLIGGVFSIGIILSFSRAAWIMFAVAFVTVFLRNIKTGAMRIFLYQACMVAILMVLVWPLIFVRTISTSRLEHMSLNDRSVYMQDARELIRAHFFFGVGPAQFVLEEKNMHPDKPLFALQPVHNVFVLAVADLGLIGVVMMVGMIFLWAQTMRKRGLFKTVLFLFLLSFAPVFFDHFLYSLPQGLWLLAFVYALAPVIHCSCTVYTPLSLDTIAKKFDN